MDTTLNEPEAKVSGEVANARKQYDIVAVPWGERIEYKLQLVA